MKKFLMLTLAAMMVFVLAACGGGNDGDEPVVEDGDEAAAMKVAMVTDYGDITDQSFNQTTYEACKEYCEGNGVEFTYKKPASDSDADRISSIEEAIEEGYNVIVMPGYAFANAIYEVAPMYEDVKFVALDVSEGDLTAYGEREFNQDNVYSAVYKEELAGYMAGYAAVKLGYTKLGFLGGMAVPAVQRYGHGFVQGADAAAEELGKSDVEIKYVYGGQFFGDADITAAMDTWYGAGTECVFACGGGIYTSACEAAAKTGGKVIGVDVDQAPTIDKDYPEMTVTSAMKGLAPTVKTLLGAIQNGEWDTYKGKIESLGLVSETPADNYVQLPDSTQWADGFQQGDYNTLVKELFDGTRAVSDETESIPAVKVVSVDDQGAIKG
ncbi:MAG: BMP family ABC transporter substrate-binding protein [Mogibacterium sp.]|nr:BMP family ABC transporter substrate-binding protein [Mogibacterium sp.]